MFAGLMRRVLGLPVGCAGLILDSAATESAVVTHVFAFQAIYAFFRLGIFYKSSATRHYVLLALASAVHFACYSFIKQQAGQFQTGLLAIRAPTVLSMTNISHTLTTVAVALTFSIIAEPTYENGELQHGGSDLSLRGSLPYYAVEVIYCLGLLQLLTGLVSDKLWCLLLAVRHIQHSMHVFCNALQHVLLSDLTFSAVAVASMGLVATVAVRATAILLCSAT